MSTHVNGKKYLILFTLHYPYHYMDSFIDPEIEKLSKEFDYIYIYSHNNGSDIIREIPSNSTANRINKRFGWKEKLSLFFLFFSKVWRQEKKNISQIYGLKLNLSHYKTAFSYFAAALKIKSEIQQLIKQKELHSGEIYVYSFFLTEATLAAALLKKQYPLKIITRLHGYDLYFERELNNYLPFRPYLLEQLNKLCFISKNGLQYFKEKLQITNSDLLNKLSVHYLGTTQFNKPANSKQDLYPGHLVIVSNSWVLPLKRLHLIADALRLISEEHLVAWVHFGDAIGIEKEYCDSFFANIEALKNSNKNIKFILQGATSRDDILNYYHQYRIDALINVSATEGVPISMMEAFSAGFSVIGTNVGGVSEIIEDGVNGYLLSPNPSLEEIVKALLKILSQKNEESEQFKQAAYRTWEKKFDAIKNSDIFVKNIMQS